MLSKSAFFMQVCWLSKQFFFCIFQRENIHFMKADDRDCFISLQVVSWYCAQHNKRQKNLAAPKVPKRKGIFLWMDLKPCDNTRCEQYNETMYINILLTIQIMQLHNCASSNSKELLLEKKIGSFINIFKIQYLRSKIHIQIYYSLKIMKFCL